MRCALAVQAARQAGVTVAWRRSSKASSAQSDARLRRRPYATASSGIFDELDSRRARRVHTRLLRLEPYEALLPLRKEPFSVWVSIIRGCDTFCTYCIVPFTRGRERSRAAADVVSEVEVAARGGAREVTLLGQNVNSYRAADGTGASSDLSA